MIKQFINSVKVKDIIISLLILGVTFGYYMDVWIFPIGDGEVEDFYELENLLYFSKMKLLIISFCLIWYFSCKHWWRSSILVIIFIEMLKLVSIFNSEQRYFDEVELYTSLPITLPIILLIFLVSRKINKYSSLKHFSTQLDAEIDEVFFKLNEYKKSEIKTLNEKYSKIKDERNISNNSDYLKNLIEIRDEFYKT